MSLFSKLSVVFDIKKRSTGTKASSLSVKSESAKKAKRLSLPKVDTSAIIRDAESKAREIVIEAKDTALKIRQEVERESQTAKQEMFRQQQILDREMAKIDRERAVLAEKQKYVDKNEAEVLTLKEDAEALKNKLLKRMEDVASMTAEEAKQKILQVYERRVTADVARIVQQAEDKAREEADSKAQEILIDAMKHGATDYVSEYTVSSVVIPNEEVKGRIIGKEGRNIRAFERASGVDLDLDETPGEIRLSCFDSVRREIAKQALKRLIADGRIQPTRIEEYLAKAREDIEKVMYEEGKKLAHAVGVYNLPREIISLLGRFKFRFSYGQNMIAHTLEETKIGIGLAQEVGANVDVVRMGCLLHDIGKVIQDEEGSHVELGVKVLRQARIPQEVIDCVEQHHEHIPFTSGEAVLVNIADAISGARPGARYENYDDYVKRLKKLEEIANSFSGVKESFAIQAGREIRVIVEPKKLSDADIIKLASDIKDRVQSEMTYPGTVTITVVRETRSSAVAK